MDNSHLPWEVCQHFHMYSSTLTDKTQIMIYIYRKFWRGYLGFLKFPTQTHLDKHNNHNAVDKITIQIKIELPKNSWEELKCSSVAKYNDLLIFEDAVVTTFCNDTALLIVDRDQENTTRKLLIANNTIVYWTRKWKIKLYERKSIRINFINKKLTEPPPEYQ